jgi:hypothetical protein
MEEHVAVEGAIDVDNYVAVCHNLRCDICLGLVANMPHIGHVEFKSGVILPALDVEFDSREHGCFSFLFFPFYIYIIS